MILNVNPFKINIIKKGDKAMEQAATGMEAIITQLTTGVTAATIFEVVGDVMPFVILLIPVSLGLYELRKVIKGAGKAKVRF